MFCLLAVAPSKNNNETNNQQLWLKTADSDVVDTVFCLLAVAPSKNNNETNNCNLRQQTVCSAYSQLRHQKTTTKPTTNNCDLRQQTVACCGHLGGNSSVDWASDWKARRNTDMGSSPRCGKGFLSWSQLPVWTLSQHLYSLRVQLHASTSVCSSKIPNTGGHTIVWTHKNPTHTGRNG